jgi:peptide/nickel transport system ATP-binding protein
VPRQHHLITLAELEKGTRETRSYQSTMSQRPLLIVKELSKVYEGGKGFMGKKSAPVAAVDNVSFEILKGETLGLVGESGCGKTTLSRMLLRLIAPTSGEIQFDGINLLALDKGAMRQMRRRMQIIFQDPFSSLNPRMTVGQAIMEPLQAFGLHRGNEETRVVDLLESVGLSGSSMHRYPHEFSGGQRQRIVIARALAVEPEFIICDESVSALDVSVQAQVLNLLNELRQSLGLTYLFISHDLNVVRHMSDRVMVMNRGRIEEMAETDKLFDNPQSDYTRRLISAAPVISA